MARKKRRTTILKPKVKIVTSKTENQKNYISEDAVLSQAAEQGLLSKTGSLGADLNKEQWHEDPFAERAAEIREKFESSK